MSLVEALPAATPMEGVLSHRPELLNKYRTFYQSFWADGLVPARILELCRQRIAYIHGCEAELAVTDVAVALEKEAREALQRGELEVFSVQERLALQVAELMPFNPHQISDDLVAQVKAHFGDAGCVALLTAVAFFDVNCRLKLVLEVPVEPLARSALSVT